MKWTGLLAAVVLLLGWFAPAAASAARADRPALLLDQDFADPDVVVTDEGQFAFSTTSASGRVPFARAERADGPWRVVGDALAADPAWADPAGGYWAPEVFRRDDGSFLMYFAAVESAPGRRCVGMAVAAAVTGPFTPFGDRPLVCDPADSTDIDPRTFVDSDGTRYLAYKSESGSTPPSAIWLQRTTRDGTALVGGRQELLRADDPSENGVVEAPVIIKQGLRYVLFYSADNFLSGGYHTAFATADTVGGPYRKAKEPLLTSARLDGAVDGPGGADVLGELVFFHGWLRGERKERGLYLLPIAFVRGRPELA
ncbi:glycoside hydrolase family 43 protein [Amycolatopsis anabasis]|uniref:glycoside hydrolase family 43 protein n=1 Tax=Amycolatopsis anabasis TaxID=1840409 RepID=UPI00131E43DF|nr:glycoside hydrolase family 43 protein [Amycolatopsis anabasis]